jgi:hypothetical protein
MQYKVTERRVRVTITEVEMQQYISCFFFTHLLTHGRISIKIYCI